MKHTGLSVFQSLILEARASHSSARYAQINQPKYYVFKKVNKQAYGTCIDFITKVNLQ